MSDNLPARRDSGLIRSGDERDALRWTAELLARSGYFRDAAGPAQAAVKILMGREVGLAPLTSVMGFHVIEGKPEYSAHLMALLVKRSGRYRYRIVDHSEERCELAWFERDGERWEPVGPSSFTLDEARRAGLIRGEKSNWVKWPKAMLFARALSSGVHMHAPDVIGGAGYVEQEIDVDAEYAPSEARTGETITTGAVMEPAAERIPDVDAEPELEPDPPPADDEAAEAELADALAPIGARRYRTDAAIAAAAVGRSDEPDDEPPASGPTPDEDDPLGGYQGGRVDAADFSKPQLIAIAESLGVDSKGQKVAVAARINALTGNASSGREPGGAGPTTTPPPASRETPATAAQNGATFDGRLVAEMLAEAERLGIGDDEVVEDLVEVLTAPGVADDEISGRGLRRDEWTQIPRSMIGNIATLFQRYAEDPSPFDEKIAEYRAVHPRGQEALDV